MLDVRQSLINSTLRKVLHRLHYPQEVMLTCVRWYVAYPLSLRHIEEMMQERGVFVDHTTSPLGAQGACCPCWLLSVVTASTPWAATGVWMRPTEDHHR